MTVSFLSLRLELQYCHTYKLVCKESISLSFIITGSMTFNQETSIDGLALTSDLDSSIIGGQLVKSVFRPCINKCSSNQLSRSNLIPLSQNSKLTWDFQTQDFCDPGRPALAFTLPAVGSDLHASFSPPSHTSSRWQQVPWNTARLKKKKEKRTVHS